MASGDGKTAGEKAELAPKLAQQVVQADVFILMNVMKYQNAFNLT